MFIFERLVGVSIYAIVLALVMLLITSSRLSLKYIFRIYILALVIMAVSYEPYVTADLYRIWELINYYGTLSFSELISNHLTVSITPAGALLFWLCGKTGWVQSVSAISVILCFSIIFYIIEDLSNRKGLQRKHTGLLVFCVMSTEVFIPVIAGIRMMIAITLILYCVYQEHKYKKFVIWHSALYFIAFTLHNMTIIIIGIIILTLVLSSNIGVIKKVIVLGGALFSAVAFVAFSGELFVTLYEKGYYFLFDEEYVDKWEYLIAGISLFLSTLIVNYAKRNNTEETFFLRFCRITIVMAIVLVFQFSIFHRLVVEMMALMILPLLADVFSENAINSKSSVRYNNIILLATLIFLLNATRGSLCALKFFVL